MDGKLLVDLLKTEVLPTMGCTEPGAVALAAARAGELLECLPDLIEVTVNSNVYKNGVAVGIPGTGETGLEIAAALGAVKKHPERMLAVLSGANGEEIVRAKRMVEGGTVKVRVDENQNKLWIKVKLAAGSDWSQVIIKESHTNIVSVERNGEYLFDNSGAEFGEADRRSVLKGDDVTIAGIVEAVEKLEPAALEFLLEGVNMNLTAAEAGLAKHLGMGIGAVLAEMTQSGVLSDDMVNFAKKLTAAAADARMSGESIGIMSSAGSGNHGITAIMPVYAAASRLGSSSRQLAKAIAISHLLTVYIKIHTGNLSALCGCAVAAATGASAAISWLMGGDKKVIEAAMKNVIANLTGMICDGGKVGCALKLSTAAAAAVESALLAQRNIIVPETNGIIANSIEDTVQNLGKISNPGMVETDKVIMKVMLEKERRKKVS